MGTGKRGGKGRRGGRTRRVLVWLSQGVSQRSSLTQPRRNDGGIRGDHLLGSGVEGKGGGRGGFKEEDDEK